MWQQEAGKGECFKEGGVNCVNAAEWLRNMALVKSPLDLTISYWEF